jgi:hypothetical protein
MGVPRVNTVHVCQGVGRSATTDIKRNATYLKLARRLAMDYEAFFSLVCFSVLSLHMPMYGRLS